MDAAMPLVHSLKALADEKRLKILGMLLSGDLCVGALAKHLGISKPAVSQHLRILRKAGLVRGEKRGYWTHYMVDREALVQIAEELSELSTRQKPSGAICWRINETPPKTHQPEEVDMCKNCCEQPTKLMDKPENCTPEQIRQCHGDTKEHPCTKEKSTSDKQ
jgi:DNA-binding transcriptional ArsR family regulator